MLIAALLVFEMMTADESDAGVRVIMYLRSKDWLVE